MTPEESIYEGDYVRAENPNTDEVHSGQVFDVSGNADPVYTVQIYEQGRATERALKVNREHITLHSSGRKSELDDLSDNNENHEQG